MSYSATLLPPGRRTLARVSASLRSATEEAEERMGEEGRGCRTKREEEEEEGGSQAGCRYGQMRREVLVSDTF